MRLASPSRRSTPEARARAILRAHLASRQWRSWRRRGYFDVESQLGNKYRIRNRRIGNVKRLSNGPTYCIMVLDYKNRMPIEDQALAQMLLLKADERAFLNIAY